MPVPVPDNSDYIKEMEDLEGRRRSIKKANLMVLDWMKKLDNEKSNLAHDLKESKFVKKMAASKPNCSQRPERIGV